MISFSKFFSNIKLVKSFKDTTDYITGKHDIESIWSDSNNVYAFYRSSGLRPITSGLFNKMKMLKS